MNNKTFPTQNSQILSKSFIKNTHVHTQRQFQQFHNILLIFVHFILIWFVIFEQVFRNFLSLHFVNKHNLMCHPLMPALLAKVLTLWICRYVLVIELIKLKLSLFSIFLGRPPDLIFYPEGYSSNLPHTPHNHQKYSWIRPCFKGVSIQ